jgi:translation initiation factor IF-2
MNTLNKVRVYEVARELGFANQDLLQKLASVGIQVRNHMSSLDAADAERVKRAIEKEKQQNVVEEHIRPTVVRRRAVKKEEPPPPVVEAAPAPASRATTESEPKRAPAQAPEAKPAPLAAPAPLRMGAAITVASPRPEGHRSVEAAATPVAAPAQSQPAAREGAAPPQRMPSVQPPGERGAAPRVDAPPRTDGARPADGAFGAPRRRELARSAIGPTGRQQAQRGRPGRARKLMPGKKGMKTEITTPSAAKRVIRIEDQVNLQVLAQRMSLKATEVLAKLMQLGMTGVMINSNLDADTAKILAAEFGFEVENVAVSDDDLITDARGSFVDDEGSRKPRPPVVTVMGHVDHGKTSLLDRIRKTNVAAGEAGGITQHLGAYRVDHKKGTIVFIDTPGHAAFTAMRARGANATDLVILVVAGDDGVMPQTKEAIHHARAAEVPLVVAINKCDKPDARPEAVMRDLSSEGLQPEAWGGDTLFFNVSAQTGQGIDELLDGVLLQSEVLELHANPKVPAEGVVLESYLDKGRGPVANLLVQNGTLTVGAAVLIGQAYGKVRAMTDDRGRAVAKAGPATPVEVLGLSEVPEAGQVFHVVTDLKVAQQIAEKRKGASLPPPASLMPKAGLDAMFDKMKEGESQDLNLVIKADVQGSAEALVKALGELSTDKVKVNVVHSGAGAITESDVMLASASHAIIVGFHVRPTGGTSKLAKDERVEIRTYDIIYEAIDEVKKAMAGLLKPTFREVSVGRAEVRQLFHISKGTIAGCFVADGKIQRSGRVRLLRDSVAVWEGAIKSLRRVKDDVREVAAGLECGVSLENFNDLKENDVIECFEVQEVSAAL